MFTQVQASVEILSPVPVSGKCSEKDYERLFIRDPEVKAREGKMAYVRPEYHERIMRITRVIGHDRLTRNFIHDCYSLLFVMKWLNNAADDPSKSQ